MTLVSVFLILFLFSATTITYVYSKRGTVRYASFSEYLRKGWPLFSPLNCLLYLFTEKRAAHPIMNLRDFPELKEIERHWQTIRDEAMALHRGQCFENLNRPGQAAHYDVGFHTFYKYGWRKFYLKWYGCQHRSALRLCPKTVEILKGIRCVNGAMFSIMPPGSQLTRHADPVACSLRYHLGLMTPNSDNCFINVDGRTYAWRDGEALLFDETYIHYVRNDTLSYRLILMCDVERPMNLLGRAINSVYKIVMRLAAVPNTNEDPSGFVSTAFRKITPLMERGRQLKMVNYRLYKLINHGINAVLLMALVGMIYGVVELVGFLAG